MDLGSWMKRLPKNTFLPRRSAQTIWGACGGLVSHAGNVAENSDGDPHPPAHRCFRGACQPHALVPEASSSPPAGLSLLHLHSQYSTQAPEETLGIRERLCCLCSKKPLKCFRQYSGFFWGPVWALRSVIASVPVNWRADFVP